MSFLGLRHEKARSGGAAGSGGIRLVILGRGGPLDEWERRLTAFSTKTILIGILMEPNFERVGAKW